LQNLAFVETVPDFVCDSFKYHFKVERLLQLRCTFLDLALKVGGALASSPPVAPLCLLPQYLLFSPLMLGEVLADDKET